ncbi:histidine kinase [Endozoicomonas sp. G2_1]|uniref:sensor histidine kinase n=1 Tax=Endozoicomonas sp. G2_1 TaxID=2821091 RepID=UPI001ADC03BE|nr:histidine kinase [Endozoicomonas sp. G2_1]MBO9488873.1 histidine kinase [Endozoicomonas sp. G2_1]
MFDKTNNRIWSLPTNAHIVQFWYMQGVFWFGLSVISFFTLTVWYHQVSLLHVGHTFLQGVFGVLLSLPLYLIFMRTWELPWLKRGVIAFSSVLVFSACWTLLRMLMFIWLTAEQGIWQDFGGWYFGSIFIFLCWSFLFHGIRYYQLLQFEHQQMLEAEASTRKQQLKVIQAQNIARAAQLKMLRYQLNPHFLCNTLNAINALIEVEEPDKAQKMTVQLSQFLRYSLDNNPDVKIPLAQEFKALVLYLDIEKTRFGNRLQLAFSIEERAKAALVPSLLLQPLVENSIKYAIAKSEAGGTISLAARVEDFSLYLTLSDSGAGNKVASSKIKSTNGRGVGLHNTIERLKNLYEASYSFDLDFQPSGGLVAKIRIPFELSNTNN